MTAMELVGMVPNPTANLLQLADQIVETIGCSGEWDSREATLLPNGSRSTLQGGAGQGYQVS